MSKLQSPNSIEIYLNQIQDLAKKKAVEKLMKTVSHSLPEGFVQTMSYGMIGYVVPHALYPSGYHCNPELPLPFINIAAQKNFVALYHMGLYANVELLNWFVSAYENLGIGKLDMGKSCIRFKKVDKIPYDLIAELCSKISVSEWIGTYEKAIKK